MEHDIEQLIRKKIMAAELQPKPWRKEAVWSKVQGTSKPARKKMLGYYYYAAACTVFVIASLLYMLSERNNHELNTRIHALTLQVEKAKADSMAANAATASSPVITLPDEACTDQHPSSKNIRPHTGETHVVTVKIPRELFQEAPSAMDELPVITQSFDSSSSLGAPVIVKKKGRVSPIIGVSDAPHDSLPIAQRKKLRIRAKPSEKEYKELQKPSDQSILARINLER
jgi:hypothetical protein